MFVDHAEPADCSEDDIGLGTALDVSLFGWDDVDHRHCELLPVSGSIVSDT
jgi:hypothetical protein